MAPPFIVRWRNALMDDPCLSSRAKIAAMPLARHANSDGKNCWPGAGRCAKEMSVSQDTIWRGWAELQAAGWMEMQPLPATRRRTQGALKVLKFAANSPADSGDVATTHPLTAANSPAHSGSTSESNWKTKGSFQEDPTDGSLRKHHDVCACGSRLMADGGCSMCD